MKQVSQRIAKLREDLMKRGFTNRSGEWFVKDELPNTALMYPDEHVIVRRAYAIDEMLKAMCQPTKYPKTHCFEIEEGDLLAGIIPMGSTGLGKVFPNYLSEEELRVGSVTNKTQMALLGHNSINYVKVLNQGLQSIIDFANAKLHPKRLMGVADRQHLIGTVQKDTAIYDPAGKKTKFVIQRGIYQPKNDKDGKSQNIYTRLGKVPVFAFGNTISDFGMFRLTSTSSHPHACYLLNHDDSIREYSYLPWHGAPDSTWQQTMQLNGWNTVNMSTEFKQVWPFSN